MAYIVKKSFSNRLRNVIDIKQNNHPMNREQIILRILLEYICRSRNIKVMDAVKESRKNNIVFCKLLYCTIAYELFMNPYYDKWGNPTNPYYSKIYTLSMVGELVNKDHSMVLYYRNTLSNMQATGHEVAKVFHSLINPCRTIIKSFMENFDSMEMKYIKIRELKKYLMSRYTTDEVEDILKAVIL